MELGVGLLQEGGDDVGALRAAGSGYFTSGPGLNLLRGLIVFRGGPTGCAVGCMLSLLRGCGRVYIRGRGGIGRGDASDLLRLCSTAEAAIPTGGVSTWAVAT